MAVVGTISLTYTDNFSRKTNEYLDKISRDPSVLTHINEIVGNAVNQYVPMLTGTLRGSMRADEIGVHWTTSYAHYQYIGEVYGRNKPLSLHGTIYGWRSPPGLNTKHPTGRILGTPGYWNGWTFGYTTPGTQHHWDEIYTTNAWTSGTNFKAKVNMEITQYVKRIANMYFAFNRG